jgi:hypothetical protein
MTVKNFLQNKFKNITNGTKFVTSFINNQPINTPFRDNDIESLLNCHPNRYKIKNIEYQYLVVRIRPPFNGKALYIKNESEESEDDVSYKYCLRALFNKYSKSENNINRIMRTFRDVISNTKRKHFFLSFTSYICQQCENAIDNLHIDHYKFTFQQILDEFICDNEIDFSSIKVFENNNEYEFEDKNLQLNWVNYHDNRVIFKALCRKCNLTNGSYGYKKNHKLYVTQ